MSTLDTRRLVLIRSVVHEPDGTSRTVIGTGYFVTAKLVLTAHHVVRADILKGVKVDVRVEAVEAGEPQWRSAEPKLVWHDAELDAALVQVSPPLTEQATTEWGMSLGQVDQDWKSVGYPLASSVIAEDEFEVKSAGLDGKLYVHGGGGQGRRELELTVNAPPKDGQWEGISGAPIFVGDHLVGLVTSTNKTFEGRRLAGVPTELLMQNPGFRLAVAPSWLHDLPRGLWFLVLVSEGSPRDLGRIVGGAIARHSEVLKLTAGEELGNEPVVVHINDVLASPERWMRFVEVMCAAPFMIVDVTYFQPGIMLLLGIRAVVRRGITITSTANNLDETKLASLPFNIQESKLISHGGTYGINDPRHPVELVGIAARNGLLELKSRSRYLDLPAYDAVRCPPPEMLSTAANVRESIVVLCPFNKKYAKNWQMLSDYLATDNPKMKVVRMLDIASPRLVGQALYEHIRWSTMCVVDWTNWRANVFFEFGVRLACSDIGPICFNAKSSLPPIFQGKGSLKSPLKQVDQLIALFRPTDYEVGGTEDPFRQAL